MLISIIACIWKNLELWYQDKLIWTISEDLKRFKKLTAWHAVIMWRKTYESILWYLKKPLPKRYNIVISRSNKPSDFENLMYVDSIDKAVEIWSQFEIVNNKWNEEIFVIWWWTIYEKLINISNKLYLTEVNETALADTFFPEYNYDFKNIESIEKNQNWLNYFFNKYERKNN